jgi:hypothetical protein
LAKNLAHFGRFIVIEKIKILGAAADRLFAAAAGEAGRISCRVEIQQKVVVVAAAATTATAIFGREFAVAAQ